MRPNGLKDWPPLRKMKAAPQLSGEGTLWLGWSCAYAQTTRAPSPPRRTDQCRCPAPPCPRPPWPMPPARHRLPAEHPAQGVASHPAVPLAIRSSRA